MVSYAIARGHEVTLFNRGKTNTDLFPDLEKLQGDRNDDISALVAEVADGRRWDAVVDNTASIPRWVTESAGLLAKASDYYLYTSSISAYADSSTPNADEAAATADSRVDAEPAAAADPAAESPATDQALADAEESAEMANAAEAPQAEAAAEVDSAVAADAEEAIDSESSDAGAEIADLETPADGAAESAEVHPGATACEFGACGDHRAFAYCLCCHSDSRIGEVLHVIQVNDQKRRL